MDYFDLDMPLMTWRGKGDACFYWTARHAVEGLQIFGGIGSGKTSGSGRKVAMKFLEANFGGVILTVKPDEKALWQHYCALAGRSNDLIIVEPGQENYFNFLDYESRDGFTDNIVQVLKTVIRASEQSSKIGGDDPFWESALDMLLFNVIDLCQLAYGEVTVQRMYDIVQGLPNNTEVERETQESNIYLEAFELAQKNVLSKIQDYPQYVKLGFAELFHNDSGLYNDIPDARRFKSLDTYFNETYKYLGGRTRTIIDFSFSGFLFRLLRDPVFTLFCSRKSTFTPEDTLSGKIILINLPIKTYHKVGRDCQIMFKYIWQRAMERIETTPSRIPVFLWADEAQNFIHELDVEFQATARACRIATVYLSQNLPNYNANMGGAKFEYRVQSFLGTLATKIFHANADIETNKYASNLFGDVEYLETSRTTNSSKDISMGQTKTLRIDKLVRPEYFAALRTGGILNEYKVDAYLHLQSNIGFEKMSPRIQFNQEINNL